MEQRADRRLSPYRIFSRADWAALRDDTPMTLTADEIARLRSLHDRLDIAEVEEIYLPLSRLLSLYVAATQRLFVAQQRFLGTEDAKMPYIIGVAGSVAVGKSTTARVLQALLARWPQRAQGRSRHHRRLPLSQRRAGARRADGEEGLSGKLRPAGAAALPLRHQGRAAAGARADLFASRLRRDAQRVDRDRPARHPDRRRPERAAGRPAAEGRQGDPVRLRLLRFLGLSRCRRGRAARMVRRPLPDAARHRLQRSEILLPPLFEIVATPRRSRPRPSIWNRINLVNLRENILPTRQRADLILKKGASHRVEEVALRRL